MPPEHVPAAGAHPTDTLVVASADHPLGGQAEDDRRHPVLMSCGSREAHSSTIAESFKGKGAWWATVQGVAHN